MKKFSVWVLISFCAGAVLAQKKPLDHSVYDSWQTIGEKMISHDGRWVAYTVNPQEGDGELHIQSADGKHSKVVPRGYNAVITADNRFVVFRIKPLFKETREARIKKKRPDDFPRDSFGIVTLGRDSVWKYPRVKNYKVPTHSFGWVAYHLEKKPEITAKGRVAAPPDFKRITDSLEKIIDSLKLTIQTMPAKKRVRDDGDWSTDADGDDPLVAMAEPGTDLILRNTNTGEERVFQNVLEYYFSKNGQKLLMEIARDAKDSLSKALVILHDLRRGFADTLSRGGNDFRSFVLSDDGSQVAYVAERDAKPRELQKYYRLWYYKEGMDSATVLVDRHTAGMVLGMTISEYATLSFSKSGKRLFFGTAPIQPPKDTTLIESELAKLDIWHYNDDYLQTVQLNRLQRDLRQSFLAVYLLDRGVVNQLGSKEIPVVYQTGEGDGARFVGVTDFGKRVESQWTNTTKKDIYAIDVEEGTFKLLKKDLQGLITPAYISPNGKYVMWYDSKLKHYFVHDGMTARNISAKITTPLTDENWDQPADPRPHGVMGWHEGDTAVYVYDHYDAWRINVAMDKEPVNIFRDRENRKAKQVVRYVPVDTMDNPRKPLKNGELIVLRVFDEVYKSWGYNLFRLGASPGADSNWITGPFKVNGLEKAKNATAFIYTSENYRTPTNLKYAMVDPAKGLTWQNSIQNSRTMSNLNPQQRNYNWGTAELYRWKALNGKMAEGILYKPEGFDENKKYPMIMYFYEVNSHTLHDYIEPQPTASRLNISFFVSRGYLVFVPDIHYTIGYPAKSAYNYIVGAAKDLIKHKWVDEKNIGLQGQSWGGIQVAQVITMTDMFKAAWAGAPVANMTSAYGGIRWESGLNRQFQYEKTQSRIGATLWEKPELYIENSPLFHVPKIKTPLVIMANDADGAVPWYQGIELFTAMRRLGKKVWMLNYNGEAHNLLKRENRKDIQIREQQYFDWLLKGEKAPKWIVEGVPAVKKGKDWGLDLVD